MVRDTMNLIIDGVDVRQNLSKLRQEIKDDDARMALLYQIGISYDVFSKLLAHEDAKVRKNTALLIGDLGIQKLVQQLFDAYTKEDKLFVKSAYLLAMKELDYRAYIPALKECLNKYQEMEIAVENQKHIAEECRVISDMIIMMEGIKEHKFKGFEESNDVVLLTNRNHINVTLEQLNTKKVKSFTAGVIARTSDLEDVLKIRTFSELLFMVPGMTTCAKDPVAAAKTIIEAKFVDYLLKRHSGKAPFYFRIELKARMELDKKSAFTKKLATELERRSNRELINSTSNYEVELRLIENKDGAFNVLVKLYTLVDDRFEYRKEVEPTSMKPVNAALSLELVKEYLKENAQIIDPFCGVGTMLIERHKLVKANTTYGIDRLESAIEKAKVNTQAARQIIHYINKDFFEFTHEYKFDEIVTDMPMAIGRKSEEEIYEIYERFFKKARTILHEDAVIIMYSHNRDFVRKLAPLSNVRIEKEYELSMKEGTYVFVLKYRY